MPEIDVWDFLELYGAMKVEKAAVYIMLTTSLNPDDALNAELNPLVKGLKNKPLTEGHLKEIQEKLAAETVKESFSH